MSKADDNSHRNSDIWYDENAYGPQPGHMQVPMVANSMYMVPGVQQQHQPNKFVSGMPTNPMHQPHMHHYQGGGSVPQPPTQQQQQQQQQAQLQQQQQQLAPSNEGYTMFPISHGNYLKVYHNNDEPAQFNQYNHYELFSNHNFIPQQMMKIVQQQDVPQQQQQQQQLPPQNYHHQQQVPDFCYSQPSMSPRTDANANTGVNSKVSSGSNNNMFINQLVENLVPNMSGTFTPFGEPPAPQHSHTVESLTTSHPAQIVRSNDFELNHVDNFDYGSLTAPTTTAINQNFIANRMHQQQTIEDIPPQSNSASVPIQLNAPSAGKQTASRTNGSFQQHNSTIKKANELMKKPRIVAEVKPMRMSYSDVLSKNVIISEQSVATAPTNGTTNAPSNGTTSTTTHNNNSNNNNSNTHKASKSSDKKGHFDKKSGSVDDKDGSAVYKNNAKNGNGATANGVSQAIGKDVKFSSSADGDSGRDASKSSDDAKQSKRKNGSGSVNKPVTGATLVSSGKPKSAPSVEPVIKKRSQSQSQPAPTTAKEDAEKDSSNNGYFYNVTKNESSLSERTSNKSTYQTKRYGSSKPSVSVSVPRNTVSNNKVEKSNSYQQKRNQRSRQNSNYAMLMRLLDTWWTYMYRALVWFVYLVYDVVVLGCSMLWDCITCGYHYTYQLTVTLWKDFRNNSGRPSAYCWTIWNNFDKRFGKDSKWAFWRNLRAKKKPPEPVPDYYKNGRLPQTGDEAMYSLLNCKGKDAYRYVGNVR